MGIDPNAPAPSKCGDFSTRPRTEPAKPPEARREGGPSQPPSRRLLLSLAAAVAVLASAGFFVLQLGDDASSSNRTLPGRKASGILAQVKGSTLTVRTGPEASVKVSTSKSTVVTMTGPGSLADIHVGDDVVVTGIPTGPDAIRAVRVENNSPRPGPFAGSGSAGTGMPQRPSGRASGHDGGFGNGYAARKVQSVTGSGFVVSGADGRLVNVSVDATTVVVVAKTVAVKDLTIGQPVAVTGASKDDGTVVATSVQQRASGFGPGSRPARDGKAETPG